MHFKIFCCSSLDLVLFENLSSHVPFQDFQELRTTLKKQQEDVSLSLMNLGVISFLHSCFVISVLWELSLRNMLRSVHLSFKMLLKMMRANATENDASNGSGEENTNVDLSANLGSLKVSRSL